MIPKVSIEIFKRYGLKATRRRAAVYELLAKADKPLDVQEINDSLELHAIRINRTTIYRILSVFFQNNLVSQVELSEGKFRYELAGSTHHHHLVCLKCDRIQEIDSCNLTSLEETIRHKLSFTVKTHKLEFFGICGSCQIGYNNFRVK